MADIRNRDYNSSTVDVVAVKGTIRATDRAGVALAAGEYDFGVIPKGAIIRSVTLNVVETFDGSSPTVAVGVEGTAEHFMAATALGVAGLVGTGLNTDTIQTASENLIFTLGGGESTVGEASVYIEYIDTAARREIFTV